MSKSRIVFWLLFATSAVLFFSPIQVQEQTGLGLDKIVHVALFAIMAYFGTKAFRDKRFQTSIFLFAYALAVEFIQTAFIAHRSGDWLDAFAGTAGIITVNLVYNYLPK